MKFTTSTLKTAIGTAGIAAAECCRRSSCLGGAAKHPGIRYQ